MFIYHGLLMLHLTALVIMAGTTFIDFVNYQTFWKLYDQKKDQAWGVLAATARFPRLMGIGAGLLVVTGACMISLAHGLQAHQLWFRIKIIFVILLIGNGVLNGNKLGLKLRKVISESAPDMVAHTMILKSKLRIYHLMQLCFFLIIIFLSAYKFN